MDDPLNYLLPEFTLGLYTSVRGYIHFWMDDKTSIQTGRNKMIIVTSRKDFQFSVYLNSGFESIKIYKTPEL